MRRSRAQRRRVCVCVCHCPAWAVRNKYDNMRTIAHVCDVQFIIEPCLHTCMHAWSGSGHEVPDWTTGYLKSRQHGKTTRVGGGWVACVGRLFFLSINILGFVGCDWTVGRKEGKRWSCSEILQI